jgi:hypothetical protein
MTLWRGSLTERRTVPLGCEAAPNATTDAFQRRIFLRLIASSAESYKGLRLILQMLSGIPYTPVELSLSARLVTPARFPLP